MTRNETRAAILIMEAYLDGYEIQKCGKHENPRESLNWFNTDDPCWDFESCYYRIKPTATLRPWTADEVPLGAWIRYKRALHDRSILAWTSNQADRDMWLEEREHSTDGGKTWSACGVVEEVK